MKQFYFRRGVASLMALLALSLLSLRALADEGTVPPAQPAASGSSSSDPAPAPAPVPGVLISRSDMADLPAGSEADVTVYFRNLGDVTLKGPVAAFSPADGVSIVGGASSFLLDDIPAGGIGSVTLKLRAADTAAGAQSLPVELRFTYGEDTPASGTATDRLNIPAKAASSASSVEKPVPNIVVQKFDYGGKPVAAGGRFPLSFTFENTGTTKVENIVVTVDGGECFTVDGGSNTAHYDGLSAGKTLTQELPLQAVPTCKSGAQAITVSFKYEYVDAGKRSPVTSDIRLSVPVSQPDRFQLNQPAAASFTAGEEGEVTLAYVNKGRADIGNLEAQLVGEGFESPAKVQYLGNVAAGTSGSIGFALTPEAAGKLDLTIKVTYEDADLQTQTKEFPLSLTVEEGAPEPDFALDDADLAPARPAWLPVIPATAALAAAAGTVFFLVKRLRRKAAGEDPVADAWSWAEAPGEDEPEQPKEE